MYNRKIVLAVVTQSLLIGSLWAGADKACISTAKATYKTDIAACKDQKGADKKTCKKTAKDNKAAAISACKTAK